MHPFRQAHYDFIPCGFEIGKDGTCAQVRLVSKDGIAYIVEMRGLRSIKKDSIFDFRSISDDGIIAYQHTFPDEGPVPDLAVAANNSGAYNLRGRGDIRPATDPNPRLELLKIRGEGWEPEPPGYAP